MLSRRIAWTSLSPSFRQYANDKSSMIIIYGDFWLTFQSHHKAGRGCKPAILHSTALSFRLRMTVSSVPGTLVGIHYRIFLCTFARWDVTAPNQVCNQCSRLLFAVLISCFTHSRRHRLCYFPSELHEWFSSEQLISTARCRKPETKAC